MKWIKLLQSIGLLHDPSTAPPHPWVQPRKDRDKKQRVVVPDNIVYNAGTPFEHHETQHGFEETRWNGRQKIDTDTAKDKRPLEWYQEKGLDPNKFEIILHCRNMGMTQAETSENLQSRFKTGFKLRTVQKYWPHLPPIGEIVS